MARPLAPVQLTIGDVLSDWKTSLLAAGKSPKTVYSYQLSAELLVRFLLENHMPMAVERITWEHVNAFQADQLAHGKPTTAMVRYKSLQQFFRWLERVDLITANPMVKVDPPKLQQNPIPVITDDTLAKLLKACSGKTLADRRDTAILRMFIDTGARLSEITNLTVEDVNKDRREIRVLGKGSRYRTIRIGFKAAEALNTYLRELRRQGKTTEALWIGPRGPLTTSGMSAILHRRCREAGVPQLNWHRFRHTAAHVWMSSPDANEGDLMTNMGWSSRAMLDRYGKSAAAERARDAHQRLALGDRV